MFARISDVAAFGHGILACPVGACPVSIVVRDVQSARIDDSENIGSERTDATRGFNLGLPGVETVVGKRPDGKPKTEYRPIHSNEFGSNRSVQEYARSHGLTPLDKGRFRSSK